MQQRLQTEHRLESVLVVGLGKSGQATAQFLLKHAESIGMTALTLVDSAQSDSLTTFAESLISKNPSKVQVEAAFGACEVPQLHYDLCIITPGLAPHTRLSKSAYKQSKEVVSEIELAYRLSPPSLQWIAITGTNGKTTTTELVRDLISAGEYDHSRQAFSVGNIGTPALEALELADAGDYFVAEVSSFQAARLSTFRSRVAALLNLSSDHLDWHKDIASYAADKCQIFTNCAQGDLVLAPDESQLHPEARPVITAALEAARKRGADVWIVQPNERDIPNELNIQGKHNLMNVHFAFAIAEHFGILTSSDIADALKSFRPPPHRMQEIGRYGDVLYVNDSKSTNPDAALQALTAYAGLELTLLLGGQGKGADYHDLAKAALARAKTIILFGQAAAELKKSFDALSSEQATEQQVVVFPTMKEATRYACKNASPQEVVMLTPANASFDEFKNYEERGNNFTQLVTSFAGSEPEAPATEDKH